MSIQLIFAAETLLLLVAGIAAILYLRSIDATEMKLVYGTVFSIWALWAIVLTGVFILTKEKAQSETQAPSTIDADKMEPVTILSIADSGPIFRNGKARQPSNRRMSKPHQGHNQRRNMRIQRKNGIGQRVTVDSCQLAVIEWKEASNV